MDETVERKHVKTRSKILWQVTILVLVVFTVSALISWYFYRRSTNNLINKSKEKLITSKAQDISSSFKFMNEILSENIQGKMDKADTIATYLNSIQTKTLTNSQRAADQVLQKMVSEKTMNLNLLFVSLPEYPPTIPKAMIYMSSDDKYLFTNTPESIKKVYKSGKDYLYLENGIPEWGLKDEQLIVFAEAGEGYFKGGITVYSTGVRPMHEDIQAITNYYNEERKTINTVLGIVVGCSLAALFLITFFVLSFLIRTRITRPIDELSIAAEKVMDGDLDVEVPVKKGEEFENLKIAFNEMIENIRRIVSRSMGED